jgi:AcrR family transcriptional regulator
VTAQSSGDRLRQALEKLVASASERPEGLTVSAVCQLANVSRNSLYRYHPDVLRAVHAHQERAASVASRRPRQAQEAEKSELAALRGQLAKLAALVDHYYAAYCEADALLGRRDQELAELRKRLDLKPRKITE